VVHDSPGGPCQAARQDRRGDGRGAARLGLAGGRFVGRARVSRVGVAGGAAGSFDDLAHAIFEAALGHDHLEVATHRGEGPLRLATGSTMSVSISSMSSCAASAEVFAVAADLAAYTHWATGVKEIHFAGNLGPSYVTATP
jgi:hypothetical protein